MPIASWNSRFLTGVEIIDRQHEALFETVNTLADAVKVNNASPRVGGYLEMLATQTQEHFITEERFLTESRNRQLRSHLEEHRALNAKLQELQAKHSHGGLVSADVALFFAEWFAHHLAEVDMANGGSNWKPAPAPGT